VRHSGNFCLASATRQNTHTCDALGLPHFAQRTLHNTSLSVGFKRTQKNFHNCASKHSANFSATILRPAAVSSCCVLLLHPCCCVLRPAIFLQLLACVHVG
jgi:hypothetical protein